MRDLVIVGAGFAGLACARAAQARGLDTLVLERQPRVGHAPHTTGLLVQEVADLLDFPRPLLRKISAVRLYSPSLRTIDLVRPGYSFFATDTGALLRWLGAGLNVRTNTPFRSAKRERDTIRLSEEVSTRFLIGADGVRSRVAETFRLGNNRATLIGAEAHFTRVRGVDPGVIHCFLDSQLAPGYLGWVVPGVDAIQVGLAVRPPARPNLPRFLERMAGCFDFDRARRVGVRAGRIPVGGPVRPFSAPGVMLLGDAAGMVSPLTAGGIHPALDLGRQAGIAIAKHLQDGVEHPAKTIARAAPRYRVKRVLRWAMNLRPANVLLDALFDSPAFRACAQTIFFHNRGLLTPAAWADLAKTFADRQHLAS